MTLGLGRVLGGAAALLLVVLAVLVLVELSQLSLLLSVLPLQFNTVSLSPLAALQLGDLPGLNETEKRADPKLPELTMASPSPSSSSSSSSSSTSSSPPSSSSSASTSTSSTHIPAAASPGGGEVSLGRAVYATALPSPAAGREDVVALCFIGLTRSLRNHTFPSIKRYILDGLAQQGFTTHVFLHTFRLDFINNPRAGEKNVTADPDEWRLLEPMVYKVDDLKQVDRLLHHKRYTAYGNAWKDDKSSNTTTMNLVRQLYSIRQCWEMVTEAKRRTGVEYRYVMFARPDVRYHMPGLPDLRKSLRCIKKKRAGLQDCLGVAYSDRFAVGVPDLVQVWATRGDLAFQFMNGTGGRKRPLHSEAFLNWVLKKHKVVTVKLPMCFERVRANGKVRRGDLDTEICQRWTSPSPWPNKRTKGQ